MEALWSLGVAKGRIRNVHAPRLRKDPSEIAKKNKTLHYTFAAGNQQSQASTGWYIENDFRRLANMELKPITKHLSQILEAFFMVYANNMNYLRLC